MRKVRPGIRARSHGGRQLLGAGMRSPARLPCGAARRGSPARVRVTAPSGVDSDALRKVPEELSRKYGAPDPGRAVQCTNDVTRRVVASDGTWADVPTGTQTHSGTALSWSKLPGLYVYYVPFAIQGKTAAADLSWSNLPVTIGQALIEPRAPFGRLTRVVTIRCRRAGPVAASTPPPVRGGRRHRRSIVAPEAPAGDRAGEPRRCDTRGGSQGRRVRAKPSRR